MNKYQKEARKSREQNRKLRMCESKAVFDTEEAAFQKGQQTYRCPYCKKWHRSGAFTKLVRTLEKRKEKR